MYSITHSLGDAMTGLQVTNETDADQTRDPRLSGMPESHGIGGNRIHAVYAFQATSVDVGNSTRGGTADTGMVSVAYIGIPR